jgi:exodeoxyribonuclease X
LLNEVSAEQLMAWSREPGLLPRVPSGPDRGKEWDRLTPESLAQFAQDKDLDVRFSAQTELARRGETRE